MGLFIDSLSFMILFIKVHMLCDVHYYIVKGISDLNTSVSSLKHLNISLGVLYYTMLPYKISLLSLR